MSDNGFTWELQRDGEHPLYGMYAKEMFPFPIGYVSCYTKTFKAFSILDGIDATWKPTFKDAQRYLESQTVFWIFKRWSKKNAD